MTLFIWCYSCSFNWWPAATSFHNQPACCGWLLSSHATLVILCLHCNFKRWPAATSFHNQPACWGWFLSSHATLVILCLHCGQPAAGCRPEAGRLKQKNVYCVCFVCLDAKIHSFCFFALRAKGKTRTLFFWFQAKQIHYFLFLHWGTKQKNRTMLVFAFALKRRHRWPPAARPAEYW